MGDDDDDVLPGDSLPGAVHDTSKSVVIALETSKSNLTKCDKSSPSVCSIQRAKSSSSKNSTLIAFLQQHTFRQETRTVVPGKLKERVRAAFKEIDQDGSGFLSKDELRDAAEYCTALPGKYIQEILEQAMSASDKDQDGVLDYEEFLEFALEETEPWWERHRVVLEIIMIFIFFFTSPLIYCNFGDVDWSFWDALYFAAVTLTTIGYGDLHPMNDMMRLFTIFYILFGLILVWRILETGVARFVEFYENQVEEFNKKMWQSASNSFSLVPSTPATPKAQHRHHSKVWVYIASRCFPDPLTWRLVSRGFWLSLILVAPVAVGTIVISLNERWPWFHGFYWSVITCTTVGYGDLTLTKESSRIFATVFVLTGFATAGVVIGKFATLKFELQMHQKNQRLLARSLSMNLIADMSREGETVDRCAFVCGMLVQMDKVSEDDLVPLLQKFDEMDADGDGELTYEDLKIVRTNRRTEYLKKRTTTDVGTPSQENGAERADIGLVNAGHLS